MRRFVLIVLTLCAIFATRQSSGAQPAGPASTSKANDWQFEPVPTPKEGDETAVLYGFITHGKSALVEGSIGDAFSLWQTEGLKLKRVCWPDGKPLVAQTLTVVSAGDPAYYLFRASKEPETPFELVEIRDGVAALLKNETGLVLGEGEGYDFGFADRSLLALALAEKDKRAAVRVSQGSFKALTLPGGKPVVARRPRIEQNPDGTLFVDPQDGTPRLLLKDGKLDPIADLPEPEGAATKWTRPALYLPGCVLEVGGDDKEVNRAWIIRNSKAEWIKDEKGRVFEGAELYAKWVAGQPLLHRIEDDPKDRDKSVHSFYRVDGTVAKLLPWLAPEPAQNVDFIDDPDLGLLCSYADKVVKGPDGDEEVRESLLCRVTEKGIVPVAYPGGERVDTLGETFPQRLGSRILICCYRGEVTNRKPVWCELKGEVAHLLQMPAAVDGESPTFKGADAAGAVLFSLRADSSPDRDKGIKCDPSIAYADDQVVKWFKDQDGEMFSDVVPADQYVYLLTGAGDSPQTIRRAHRK
ncbi:MAG: hypothetical protein IT462_04410 [Planctomycetes bacterium]|nr:hypothetical protein [Planctomycetota bacterium]